jgi:hypothetical protein
MPGKIFVNYRRDDAAGDARGGRDGLAAKFGEPNVFMDGPAPHPCPAAQQMGQNKTRAPTVRLLFGSTHR